MATARKQRKSTRGTRICGAVGCGKAIQPGEEYFWWKFRSGGRHVRCLAHPPLHHELTQSKMSTVYEAMEAARKEFGTLEETKAAIENLATAVEEVVQEYRDSAESFGGSGPNAERADELEGWLSELQSFEPDEPEQEEFNEEEVGPEVSQDLFGIDEPTELDEEQRMAWADAMQGHRDAWDDEHGDNDEAAAESAKEEAEDLLGQCPL